MDKLAEVLGQLSQQLGMTVNRLWPHVVLVTYFTSLAWLGVDFVTVFLTGIGSFVVLRIILASAKERNDNGLSTSGEWTAFTIVLLFSLTILIVVFANLPNVVAGIAEPEGMTVYRLLGK